VEKLIDVQDVLMAAGLILLGIGLFLWWGAGVSLSVVGTILFCVGFFSGAMTKGKK